MSNMLRYTVQWTAGSGGAGTSTFHFGNTVAGQAAAVRAFFDSIKGNFPSDVTWSFPGEYEDVSVETGTLLGVVATAPPASVVGVGTTAYAAPAGARVRWLTAGIRNGRRVTGTTFLVPLLASAFEGNGTLTSGTITSLNSAAATLRGATNMVVWSRPTAGGGAGAIQNVTGSDTPDRVAVLRSRRD